MRRGSYSPVGEWALFGENHSHSGVLGPLSGQNNVSVELNDMLCAIVKGRALPSS